MSKQRGLSIFLCHLSKDKSRVRDLYKQLSKEDGFLPWLDEENLLPGQDWDTEIKRAIRSADVVIVCISRASITKEGYVQKEIKTALDIVEEKPEGTIFLIPLRLENCKVPEKLNKYHWVDYFGEAMDLENGYSKLLASLETRKETTIKPFSKQPNIPVRKPKLPLGRIYQPSKFFRVEKTKEKYRALWVDSNARELRRLTSPIYISGMYELDLAEDVTTAVRYLMAKEYDAVILDIRLAPGTDDYWINIYREMGEDKVQAWLGLYLMDWMLNGRNDFPIKPPDWITPQQIAVFTVESISALHTKLEHLKITTFEHKTAGLPDTVLIEIINKVEAQKSEPKNRQ